MGTPHPGTTGSTTPAQFPHDTRFDTDLDSERPPAAGPISIGPYRVCGELGRGSFGAVFLAERDGRTYAVKVLRDHALEDAEAVSRFEREVKLMSRLDHPGIVGVLDVGRHHDRLYYAMDYVDGETLKAHLRQRAPLPVREAVDLVRQIAKALHSAHELGMVHRDVKPSNVIIEDGTGFARLTDFGFARHRWARDRLTQTGDTFGTPSYMSPEQFDTAAVDRRADVYSLGVILFQALSGRLPFVADSVLELEGLVHESELPSLRSLRAGLPASLEEITRRALARDPDDRYRTAADLQVDLGEFLQTYVEDAPVSTPARPPWVAPVAFGLAVVGVAALAGIVALRNSDSAPVAEAPPAVAPQPRPAPPAPAPVAPPPSRDEVLAEVFAEARRGVNTELLFTQLADAGLESEDLAIANTRLAFRRGRLRDAARFGEPLTGSPSRAAREAQLSRGLALTFLFEFAHATETLKTLSGDRDVVGRTAGGFLALADDYVFSQQDYAEALQLLGSVRNEEPEFLPAILCLAYYLVAIDDPRGLQLSGEAQRLAPDHWLPLHMRGRYLRTNPQRVAVAVRDLQSAADMTGGDCEPTLNYLVHALLLDRRPAEATKRLEQAQAKHPNSTSLLAVEVVIWELSNRPERAEEVFQELVKVAGPFRARQEIMWLPAGLLEPGTRVAQRVLLGR